MSWKSSSSGWPGRRCLGREGGAAFEVCTPPSLLWGVGVNLCPWQGHPCLIRIHIRCVWHVAAWLLLGRSSWWVKLRSQLCISWFLLCLLWQAHLLLDDIYFNYLCLPAAREVVLGSLSRALLAKWPVPGYGFPSPRQDKWMHFIHTLVSG